MVTKSKPKKRNPMKDKTELGRVALFDGGWFMHRAAHAAHRNRPNSWLKVAPDFVVSWVFTTAVRLQCKQLAVLFDSDSSFRKKLYPEYKSNRGGSKLSKGAGYDGDEPEMGVYEVKVPLMLRLRELNVPCWEVPGYEADDLFASYAKNMPRTHHAFLVTKDKDMVQLVNSRVTCYIPPVSKQPEVFTTPENVQEQRLGFTATQFLDYQTLVGDSIDCVPSILKPSKAKALLQEHGSLQTFFKTKEGLQFFNQHQEQLLLNRKLVKLHSDAFDNFPSAEIKRVITANVKTSAAYDAFAKFAFSSSRRLF